LNSIPMHGRNEGERRNGGRGVGGETERERVEREDRMEKGGGEVHTHSHRSTTLSKKLTLYWVMIPFGRAEGCQVIWRLMWKMFTTRRS